MDAETAKEVLVKEMQERKQAFQKDFTEMHEALSEKHGFRLSVGVQITESGFKPLLDAVPTK